MEEGWWDARVLGAFWKRSKKEGTLSSEPEVELSSKDRPRTKLASSSSTQNTATTQASGKKDKSKRKHESSDEEEDAQGVKGDDFFAQDSDDEE